MNYCALCLKKITGKYSSRKKYCDKTCAQKFYIDKVQKINPTYNLPTGTIGALNELRVCMDLLGKYFHVYRAISPSCKCDLIAHRGEKLFSVEVTTGYYDSEGTLHHGKKNLKKIWDVLAIATKCGRIVYETDIKEFKMCKKFQGLK